MSGLMSSSRVEEWIADLGAAASSSGAVSGGADSEVSTREAVSLPSVSQQSAATSRRPSQPPPPARPGHGASASTAWLMAKTDGGPVKVKLGHIRGPNEFWVIPLPQRQNENGEPEGLDRKSRLYRILKVEEKLDELYGKGSEAGSSKEGRITDTEVKKGMLVAARLQQTGHWHRARVVEVSYRSGITFVRVFLIDYGEYTYEIPLRMGVRRLPTKLSVLPKPLAFLLILKGLKPLSYGLNFMEGDKTFEEISTTRWTESADRFVRDVCRGSTSEGTLTNYTFDSAKKCHGVLDLHGYASGPVRLNTLLVKAKHAKATTGADLHHSTVTSCGIVPMPRNLSICGSEVEPGTITIPESVDFTDDNFQMDDYLPVPSADLSVATDVSESSSRFGDVHQLSLFKVLDPETGTKPNTYNKMSRSMTKRFLRSTPVTGSLNSSRHDSESEERGSGGVNTSFEIGGGEAGRSGSQAGGGGKLTNRALLAKIQAEKKRKARAELNSSMASSINHPQSSNRSHSTIWESFREDDSDDDTDVEDTEETAGGLDDDSRHRRRLAKRHQKALLNNTKIQMLPAGVDTGKFLEEQLRRVKNYGVGPKKIAELLD